MKGLSDLVMQNVLLQLEIELLSSPLALWYPFPLEMSFLKPPFVFAVYTGMSVLECNGANQLPAEMCEYCLSLGSIALVSSPSNTLSNSRCGKPNQSSVSVKRCNVHIFSQYVYKFSFEELIILAMGVTCNIKSFHCVCQNVEIFYSSLSSTTHPDFQSVRKNVLFRILLTLVEPVPELCADINEAHGLY